MITVLVSKSKVLECRNCGQTVIKRVTKKKKTILADVYQQDGKLVLIMKNQSLVEHKC